MMQHQDHIERRIVVEYGRRYVYITMQDASGKIIPGYEEVFSQPFVLDRKDAWEEAGDCWHDVYQFVSDTCVWPLPEAEDGPAQSGEEDAT
jgi:hypothetical protein